jgi:carboxypeptidase Q
MTIKVARLLPAVIFSAALISFAAEKPKTAPPAATVDPYAEVQPATELLDINMYQRIREEGLNHSHVMEFA